MIITNTPKFSYKDITIIPAKISEINYRGEVIPYDSAGMLPIFTAPMSCVVNENNYKHFEENGIHSVIPTTVEFITRLVLLAEGQWAAFSLRETELLLLNGLFNKQDFTYHICIDCANGHMRRLLQLCKSIKMYETKTRHIEIMTGNIANPDTYPEYCKAGIDYVRVGIGSGSACITSTQTGIHYPMASLLDGINKYKSSYISRKDFYTKIIADGGIRNYSDVIKALALGADYVMIGGLFTECLEAASEEYSITKGFDNKEQYKPVNNLPINSKYTSSEGAKRQVIEDFELYHEVYGMSTKRVQEMRGQEKKTSEGTQHFMPIKYTLYQWTENMNSYLRSAMSYCNCLTLEDFIGKQNLIVNNSNTINK